MIHIDKHETPAWLSELQKQDPSIGGYDDLSPTAKRRLRQELIDEQFCLCGYCCGQISIDHSHNEHITPRSATSGKQSLDYGNIIASCNGLSHNADHCGHKKGSTYAAGAYVSPLEEDCEQHFKYYINGEIVGNSPAATDTIQLLNLNSGGLKNARRGILRQSFALNGNDANEYYLKPLEGKLPPFCNIVRYFLRTRSDLYREAEEGQ